MADSSREGGPVTPPLGTSRRIRNRGIWAVAFFAASVLPAIVGMGVGDLQGDGITVALPIAFAMWAIGALASIAAALPTLRYWDGLPTQTRLLGALPLLTVSFFLSAALVGSLLA